MADYNYNAPNLASILANLASLSSQSQPPPRQPATIEESQQLNRASQAPQVPEPVPAPARKIVDPATIIEWSAGLRCVMKTVAVHENVLNDIRRMMKTQHEHEEQWFNGRVELIKRQASRAEGQKKLDEVMRAVGGALSSAPSINTVEEMARELETFDMKVYRAQLEMTRQMTSKLQEFGVPFFGTKSELVRTRIQGEGDREASTQDKGTIDETELVKLQRRMLTILEDLCSD
ncbi:hypothetical protein M7I_5569 [Glarea lozoyensis 74030]|uniref:Uncharacterized protein n=1 Tax=Glarea lozoyensis (strain ATCC 74030 / MF5533) TaxID=1104152 RepID=H0ES91_GLAL7|nr:hypothetical protein M7I_5569 [Glarea lozoyensis 74030]